MDALIDPEGPRDRSPAAIRARAERRLDRARRFLRYLGNPHDRFPVVHVGGTSGKGSTCAAIAAMLDAAGYRVGLHTSPYLQVATEKLQIGQHLIGAEAFADLVDETLEAAAAWPAGSGEDGDGPLRYGEIWMAMTARWFAAERVDVGVIEVGAGGRFDVTNVVRPAVAVITSVGLDHTATLGRTIPEIAWHKAGIIKAGAPVITAVTDPTALAIFAGEAAAVGAELIRVTPGTSIEVLGTGVEGTRWREIGGEGTVGPIFGTPLPGRHQAANAASALAAVRMLRDRGFAVSEEETRRGLAGARLPGRFEVMPAGLDGQRVILDGAHNPDKIAALVADLPMLLGEQWRAGAVIVLGAVSGKDARRIVHRLLPHAAALVVSAPRVRGKEPIAPDDLAHVARQAGFGGPVLVEPEPVAALETAQSLAGRRRMAVVVTGSLFLVGAVRGAWYPAEAIVRQRTPWPEIQDEGSR